MMQRWFGSVVFLLLVPMPVVADNFVPSGPLRVRNLSPTTQIYGLPRVVGARVLESGVEASFNLEIANNFDAESSQGTFASFDGESYVTSYRVRGGVGGRFEWGVEIPYVTHSGGELDAFIDQFHDLFGFNDGGRPSIARNQLNYIVSQNGSVEVNLDGPEQGIGDVRGFAGYSLFADSQHALALRAQVKLPTGEIDDLTGSEAADAAIWGEYERRLQIWGQPVHVSLAAGAGFLGEGELLADDQNQAIGFGHFGLQFPVYKRWSFKAQLDGHSDIFDNPNGLVGGGGLLGTLGGRVNFTKKFWVDLSVIEDLANDSASDVVFQINLGADLSKN